MCETLRLSGGRAEGRYFRNFHRYFVFPAVQVSSVCPPDPLCTFPAVLHAQDCITRLLCPLASSWVQPKFGGHWQEMEGQENKVRVFISQQGHFRGLCSCQVAVSIQLSLSLGSCNSSLPCPLQV